MKFNLHLGKATLLCEQFVYYQNRINSFSAEMEKNEKCNRNQLNSKKLSENLMRDLILRDLTLTGECESGYVWRA